VAREDRERRQLLAGIGPLWDGNEVWLIALAGALMVAFPRVLTAALSGFYLPVFFLLWSLIMRGLSIELRSHVQSPLWRAFWDFMFWASSTLLTFLLGVTLGNLVRGVPLDESGWFELQLFTNFRTHAAASVGLLDWYTLLVGLFAVVALSAHGAAFLAWKTDGTVEQRARVTTLRLYALTALLWPVVTFATTRVSPSLIAHLPTRPLAWAFSALALSGLLSVFIFTDRRPLFAFLGSCAFLSGLLAAIATCLFPSLLRATTDLSLTTACSSDRHTLVLALRWWLLGIPLVIAYFTLNFRLHRGKTPASDGEPY
jgi:cytochrome d ubiquinol oxidase subunit II